MAPADPAPGARDAPLQIAAWQNAASGAAAGLVSRAVIAPLDVVKIRLQIQPSQVKTIQNIVIGAGGSNHPAISTATQTPKYRSIMHTAQVIIREEGILALWKGNMSAEYLYLAYGAIQFFAFHELMKESRREDSFIFRHIPKSTHTFVAGATAGVGATFITYPLDLLRTRFAVQSNNRIYTSILDAVRQIMAMEGIRGFYRGITPTLVQIVPAMGIVFEAHRFFKRRFQEIKLAMPKVYRWIGGSEELVSGGLAGVVSKTAVMPFDVIRKRFQVQGPHRNEIVVSDVPRYTRGLIMTAAQIVRHEGLLALYKGLAPSLLKAAPSTAITFFIVNQCQRFFSQYNDAVEEQRKQQRNR